MLIAAQGMYPTAIVALVAIHKSHLDHQFTFPPSMHSPTTDTETLPFTVKAEHSKDLTLGSTAVGTWDCRTSTRYGASESIGITARMVARQTAAVHGTTMSESAGHTGMEKDGGSPVTALEGIRLVR